MDVEHRTQKAEALAERAKGMGFANWFILAFEADDKWVATVSPSFDIERMKTVRDWLTRQIDQEEKSNGNEK